MAVAYALVTGVVVYGLITKLIGFRMPDEAEFAGPDLAIHQIHAYPEDYVK
jgi:Amt family ammonium transporter